MGNSGGVEYKTRLLENMRPDSRNSSLLEVLGFMGILKSEDISKIV